MKVNLASKMAETGISTAAILHLAAALPAVDWGVGFSSQHLTDDILKTPHVFDGLSRAGGGAGIEWMRQGPGRAGRWAIEVDEARRSGATRAEAYTSTA